MKGKGTITIVLGFVCFVLVAVMFMQFKTISQTDITSIEMMRETELREEMASWKLKYEEVSKKLEDTNNKIEEYQQTSKDNKKATELLESELRQAKTKLGLTNVVGDGVIVTLTDNNNISDNEDSEIYDRRISVYDLLQLINELKLAGAEAIEINGVRIVNKSDIALITDSFIKIDGHRMNSPYVVKAIGNPTTLESGLMQKNSGYIDKVIKPYDKLATVEKAKQIEIAKYDAEWKLKYIEGEE